MFWLILVFIGISGIRAILDFSGGVWEHSWCWGIWFALLDMP
jgi:hypothetical protein